MALSMIDAFRDINVEVKLTPLTWPTWLHVDRHRRRLPIS